MTTFLKDHLDIIDSRLRVGTSSEACQWAIEKNFGNVIQEHFCLMLSMYQDLDRILLLKGPVPCIGIGHIMSSSCLID